MDWPILELKTPWPLVNVEEEAGELVVRFHEEAFVWPAVEEVGRALMHLLDEMEDAALVVDMSNIERLGGMGLENLARLHRKLQARGGMLAIRNAPGEIRQRLFDLNIHERDTVPLGNTGHGHHRPQELESDS